VIHELLIGTGPKARPVLTWNMLIGGPNQSHKVNFKEPPLVRGKISKRTFAFCSVNTFPENLRKKFWEGTLFSRALRLPRPRLAEGIERREREHGNCIFLIKFFLVTKSYLILSNSFACICAVIFFGKSHQFPGARNTDALGQADFYSYQAHKY